MSADYHTHTPLCLHAEGTPEQYIDAAIDAGLTEYGISDHAPLQKPDDSEPFDDWRMLSTQIPDYLTWIAAAKAHAGERITIRCGLECDWLPGSRNEAWTQHLRTLHPWDYLIGSVHYIADTSIAPWDFDNPKWLGKWAKSEKDGDIHQAWDLYWKAYTAMADSGLYDILAHPDLIKKFGYKPPGDLTRYYEPAIDAIATAGSIIEINTAGLHKPCAEVYPDTAFLELARDAGIDLIISSDAHHPSEVARDRSTATEIAKAAGYTHTTLINQRQRSYVAL
ncbi:MAG: histidinol-phosphatase (PHP family) [Cryomorphaceae bacterium]|jgi:histidinol-phosphatase (PHP family)